MKYFFQSVHFGLDSVEKGLHPGPSTWGFYVYRTTYTHGSNEVWEDYLEHLRTSAIQFLVDNCDPLGAPATSQGGHTVPPASDAHDQAVSDQSISQISQEMESVRLSADPTISTALSAGHGRNVTPEDRRLISTFALRIREDASLDGLDIDQARGVFQHQARAVFEEYPDLYTSDWPRYGYFVYVNDEVLQRFTDAKKAGSLSHGIDDRAVAILVEADLDCRFEEDSDCEDEDDEELLMGWQYVLPRALPSMYDGLSSTNAGWYDFFVFPPNVRYAYFP